MDMAGQIISAGLGAGAVGGEPCWTLADLGRIDCVPVADAEGQRHWDELMLAEHFLGAGPLVGRRLCYRVSSEHFGVVGALAFSAAAWRLGGRDRFIGWSEAARQAHLQRVVCNSRFLIRVRVPQLASHVLARCLRRLPADWQARYGESPVLVETFIDRRRHRGGCYRAANWQYVGDTRGRGRNDTEHAGARSIKAVYVYPLCRDWREQLGASQAAPREPALDDWARHELAHALPGDRRLRERAIIVSRDFAAQSTAPLPQACGTRARAKAAYRLFDNPRVTMDALLHSHQLATAGRCRQHPIVLAVQDTTSLNYSAHPATEGLGPIGASRDGAQGLIVHDTMAFTPAGTPLGLVDVQCWARDPDTHGYRRLAGADPRGLDDKESGKWLDSHCAASQIQQQIEATRMVSVADREGDLYELLLAVQQPGAADVLVRAKHPRRLAGSAHRLIDHLDALPVAGVRELAIPRRGNKPARTARLAVRYAPVRLKPPDNKRDLPEVDCYAVRTTEIDPPEGVKPLVWTLLTTVATETFAEACERLDWYAARWSIEVYHRTFKSGCRIKDRQLGTAQRLESCLAIDLIVAWQVFALARVARERPDAPANMYFEDDQWKALLVRTGINADPQPENEPTLREAMRLVAHLGGFLGRKGDGEPGTQTLWRGLQRLDDITFMFRELKRALTANRGPP